MAADCSPKVEAEFQRLRTSGGAYRIETVVNGDQQERTEIFEFVPPDRMRLRYRFKAGDDWAEFVRVGDRIWDHEKELPSELANVFDEQTKRLGRPLGAFECLGPVKFSGKTYTGYRTNQLQSDLPSGELTGARFSSIGRRGRWLTKWLRWRNSSARPNGGSATPTPTTLLSTRLSSEPDPFSA
jgi:hypothetical protein